MSRHVPADFDLAEPAAAAGAGALRPYISRVWWLALWIVYVACVAIAWQSNHAHAAGRPQEAYIGPGAGVALLGSCFAVFVAILTGLLYLASLPFRLIWQIVRGRKKYAAAKTKRVVVIGLDGLEPTLTEQFLEEGRLPNLANLRASGCYQRLGTTWPPLSPVAWSSFSTGSNPGKHNIFDFINRTPDYRAMMSSVRIRDPRRTLKLFGLAIPLEKPEITALRKSRPFWSVLGDAGIFSAIIRVPITFPPDKFRGVQLSAMCVPDLRGTQGTFTCYLESAASAAADTGGAADGGGDRIRVERVGDEIRSYVRGPANSLRVNHPELRMPFRVFPSKNTTAGGNVASAAATLHIGGEVVPLRVGHHSPWVRVSFAAAPGIRVHGVCRFVLKSVKPFEMYCTPLQIDPDKPVMPISHPLVYSSYLARMHGTYSTLGLAEDTGSLSERVLSEDGFLEQAYAIHAERESMLFDALDKVRRGVVVCVFDGPDRIQHMFWRFIDDQHPALTDAQRASHRDAIRQMYERMDELIGRIAAKLGPDTTLFVMSDHGFKPFRRGVDLNAWLRDNGYLHLKDGRRSSATPYLADVDWSKTRAYAVGLAGIFLNVKGRESSGIVEPGAAAALASEIAGRLTGLGDEARGEVAVREAVWRDAVYRGPYVENAPDIIVGYNVGYRVSWEAATGKCGEAVFSDNKKAWSGDHCVHPALVPGVLFCNRKLPPKDDANIVDLAPTILDLFGQQKPAYMDGKSLLGASV